jgi:hypothetical protein
MLTFTSNINLSIGTLIILRFTAYWLMNWTFSNQPTIFRLIRLFHVYHYWQYYYCQFPCQIDSSYPNEQQFTRFRSIILKSSKQVYFDIWLVFSHWDGITKTIYIKWQKALVAFSRQSSAFWFISKRLSQISCLIE